MINKRTHDDLASDVMVLPAFNLIVNIIIAINTIVFINSNIIFSNHCIPCISITTGDPPPPPPSVWQCWSSHCIKSMPGLCVPPVPENVGFEGNISILVTDVVKPELIVRPHLVVGNVWVRPPARFHLYTFSKLS